MRLLFVHKHFPGQFLHLALTFAAQPDNEVVFLSAEDGISIPGIRAIRVQPSRASASPTHNLVQPFENAVLLGQATYNACAKLRDEGFIPDLIYAHAGFGPGLFLRDAFPGAPIIGYFEWFYNAAGSGGNFRLPNDMADDEALRTRTNNANLLLDLVQCDRGICPTAFQMDQFPQEFHDKLHVIHEGIDATFYSPDRRGRLSLDGIQLGDDAEIVTYAARGMEPCRGFPQFIRAIATLQRLRPRLHAVIVGEDTVVYGKRRSDDKSWKEAMLLELPDLDLDRTHFTGTLPIQLYRKVLRASHAHVYLTAPFMLSCSLLEAMAIGCTVVGSATAPVCEVIQDGETGLLADFVDPFRLAGRIGEALDNPDKALRIGSAARDYIVEHYDLASILPPHLRLANHVLGRDTLIHPLAEQQPAAKRA